MKIPKLKLTEKPSSILFVCLGNICRSPTAHGIFEKLLTDAEMHENIHVDSAGTAAYHVGNQADKRMRATAKKYDFDLDHLRARAVCSSDFYDFDLVLAMDEENYFDLIQECPDELQHKIGLLMDFSENNESRIVPDPYYGGQDGFDHVVKIVSEACERLLDDIQAL